MLSEVIQPSYLQLAPNDVWWVTTLTLDDNPASFMISINTFARFSLLWLPLASQKASSNVQSDHSAGVSGVLCTQWRLRYGSRANDDQSSNVTDISPGMFWNACDLRQICRWRMITANSSFKVSRTLCAFSWMALVTLVCCGISQSLVEGHWNTSKWQKAAQYTSEKA